LENKSISIIIPILNEAENIDNLMANLEQLTGDFEVIFCDGGSTDDTVALIGDRFKVVTAPIKGRAYQMNTGAQASSGDVLFFLHADSVLPVTAISEIICVLEKGYDVGCFKIAFDSHSFWMKCCGFFSNLRVRTRNIAFGDQGIFIKRELFEQLGGFPELPLMEDYKLSINLKKQGYKFGMTNKKLLTSERRFVKNGRLKTMWKMQRLQAMFRAGEDIDRIASMYRDR
jgi:rSAM/selenodomain-associated transferase 2